MKKTIQKFTGALASAIAFGFALAAAAGPKTTSYLTSDITSDEDIKKTTKLASNITWDNENKCAVFNGQASYIQIENPLKGVTLNTGFTIKMEAYISSENDKSGTYTNRDGNQELKNGWQRLFDLSDGTVTHYLFLNAGNAAHLRAAVCYDSSESMMTPTSTYYDAWHTYELIMAPGGYMTLYVDGNYVTYMKNDDKVNGLMSMIDDLNVCYLGTSVYEFSPYTNTDGFFFGKMRNVQFMNEPTRPAYDGTGFRYRLLYNSCGATDPDAIMTSTVPATLPSLTEAGHTFLGWFKDPAYTQPAETGVAMTTNLTLYAKWSPAFHCHCICGASGTAAHCAADHNETELTWTAWTATDSLPTSAGNWYLANDVYLTAEYEPVDGVNLCLNGHTVKQTTSGQHVILCKVLSGTKTFCLTDCGTTGQITGGSSSDYGGGVRVVGNGSSAYATFKFYAGSICGNESRFNGEEYKAQGGGVGIDGACCFYMYGGSISNNIAYGTKSNSGNGGGISAMGSGTVTLYGGEICCNYASRWGGGICTSCDHFSIKGPVRIYGNSATAGGGLSADAAVTAEGAEIFGNSATAKPSDVAMGVSGAHAGVVLDTKGDSSFKNCKIYNNTALQQSGGVLFASGANSVTLSESVVITNNTVGGVAANLYFTSGKKVTLSSLASDSKIGVTLASAPAKGSNTAFTTNGADADRTSFFSDNSTYLVVYDTDHLALRYPQDKTEIVPDAPNGATAVVKQGDVMLSPDASGKYFVEKGTANVTVVYTATNGCYFADVTTNKICTVDTSVIPATIADKPTSVLAAHRHCICGDGTCSVGGHTHTELTWKPWTATDSLPTTADNWYLANDVTLTAEYAPVSGVNLCLNGHVIKQTKGSSRVMQVSSGCTVLVTDCDNKTTPHKFTVGSNGLWALNESAGTEIVKGGCLTGGSFSGHGGGVFVAGAFTMYCGNIVGNFATYGAGLKTDNSTPPTAEVTLRNVRVCGNQANAHCGGVYIAQCLAYEMSGCMIDRNIAAKWGGGVNLSPPTGPGIIQDCLIASNRITDTSVSYGGGFHCAPRASLMVENTKIIDNVSGERAGGISLCNGIVTLKDVTVTGNTSASMGAAYYSGGTVILAGKTVIDGNMLGGKAANLYLESGNRLAVSTTDPLSSGSRIGVTTAVNPVPYQPVAISSNGVAGVEALFTSDVSPHIVKFAGDHLVLSVPDVEVKASDPLPDHVDSFKVYTNGVEVALTEGKYLVPSNATDVTVVYTPASGYYFDDGTTAKTNTLTAAQTGTNPATLPAAPSAPVLGVVKVTTASSTTYYETLAPAFSKVGVGGTGTVTMLRDLTLAETGAAWVPNGSDVTFDLNGKKIDWTTSKGDSLIYFDEGTNGKLKITDSASDGTISSHCTSTEVTNSAIVVYCKGNGDLTVEGGSFVCSNKIGAATLFFKEGNGNWTFKNGTYTALSEGAGSADFLYCRAATGTTVIEDGDFDITAKGAAASGIGANDTCKETITISGGDFDISSAGEWYGAFTAGNGTLIAKGGDFNVVSSGAGVSCFTAEREGTTIISNGTFYAESKGAYAYAASACATGNLVVAGGTLSAKAASDTCATVIGKNASTVTIVNDPTIVLPTGTAWNLSVETVGGYLDFTGYTGADFDQFAVFADDVYGASYVKGDMAKVANGTIFDGFFSTHPEEGWVQNGKYPLHNTNAATRVVYPWTVGLVVVNFTPPAVPNTTVTVCTNGAPMTVTDPYILPTNATDVTVIYTAKPGYTFPDGTTVKTNTVDASTNPAMTQGTLPSDPLAFVEVQEPVPPMEHTTFKVLTNGVEIAKSGDKWLVVSNTAPVEIVYEADPDWYFSNRVAVVTNKVNATTDPVTDANQPEAPWQYVEIIPESIPFTDVKVFLDGKEITPPPYYVPSNATPVTIVYETKPGYTFSDGSTSKTNDVDATTDPATLVGAPHTDWTLKMLLVYDAAGGLFDAADSTRIVSVDALAPTYAFPPEPARADFTFLGWYDGIGAAANKITEGGVASLATANLFAKWQSDAVAPGTPSGSGGDTADGLAVTNYRPTTVIADGNIVIPDTIDNTSTGKAIVDIARGAYNPANYAGAVKAVTIPQFVTDIRPYAFADHPELLSATFAVARDYKTGAKEALYIRDWAFANTGLKTITFTAGGTFKIGFNAFSDVAGVEDIYLYGTIDIADWTKSPFRQIGTDLPAGKKVKIHLSPAMAADPAYVAAITNGMDNAFVMLDQEVLGTVYTSTFSVGAATLEIGFTIAADAPWQVATPANTYLLFSGDASDVVVGTGRVLKPTAVTLQDDGSWKATFDKPFEATGFFRVCVGAAD